MWPFGRTVVNRPGAGVPSFLGNVLWFFFAGLWLAFGHLITGLLLRSRSSASVGAGQLEAHPGFAGTSGKADCAGLTRRELDGRICPNGTFRRYFEARPPTPPPDTPMTTEPNESIERDLTRAARDAIIERDGGLCAPPALKSATSMATARTRPT